MKEKIKKRNLTNINMYCRMRDTLNKVTRQAPHWKKTFVKEKKTYIKVY